MVKNIIATDKNNLNTLYSVQEIRAQKLNNWKGWNCNALQYVLSIDEKGDVRGGDCESAGYLGNIYKEIDFPKNLWITCPLDWCKCYLDMHTPKKSNDKNSFLQEIKGVDQEKYISWYLLKQCNFDCWYCPTSIHSKEKDKQKFEDIIKAINKFYKLGWQNAKFTFWGGEPTLFKNYIEICKYLHNSNSKVTTNTNGSRSIDYLINLSNYSNLNISIHRQEVNFRKMYDKLKALSNRNNENWVIVKCMIEPKCLFKWKSFLNAIHRIENISIQLNTLWGISDDRTAWTGEQMNGYADKELELISNFGQFK
tara:strand:- start:112 stop:1041 length:930 start_codon:yes stop_codon:yes gene_type:complete